MTNVETRIAALEAENRDLKARLDALQLLTSAKPASPRRNESPVKISYPTSQISMPSHDECRQLCDVVWRRYPKLRPSPGEEEEFAGQFRAAFQFVQHDGRRAVDRERSLGWWLDTAREHISQHRIGGSPISGTALVVAIIAAGDVPFSDPGEPGFVVGLQWGGGGIAERGWWKRVLNGTILEATPPLHPTPMPAPSRIVRG